MAWIFSLISGTKDIEPTNHTDLKSRIPFGNYEDKTRHVLFSILYVDVGKMFDSFSNIDTYLHFRYLSESPQNHQKWLTIARFCFKNAQEFIK